MCQDEIDAIDAMRALAVAAQGGQQAGPVNVSALWQFLPKAACDARSSPAFPAQQSPRSATVSSPTVQAGGLLEGSYAGCSDTVGSLEYSKFPVTVSGAPKSMGSDVMEGLLDTVVLAPREEDPRTAEWRQRAERAEAAAKALEAEVARQGDEVDRLAQLNEEVAQLKAALQPPSPPPAPLTSDAAGLVLAAAGRLEAFLLEAAEEVRRVHEARGGGGTPTGDVVPQVPHICLSELALMTDTEGTSDGQSQDAPMGGIMRLLEAADGERDCIVELVHGAQPAAVAADALMALQEDLAASQAETMRLSQDIDTARAELANAREQLTEAVMKQGAADGRVQALEQEVAALTEADARAATEAAALSEADLSAVTVRMARLEETATMERHRHNEELSAVAARVAELEAALEGAQQGAEELERRLDAARSAEGASRERVRELEAACAAKETECERLGAENRGLLERVAAQERSDEGAADREALEEAVAERDATAAALRRQVGELQEELGLVLDAQLECEGRVLELEEAGAGTRAEAARCAALEADLQGYRELAEELTERVEGFKDDAADMVKLSLYKKKCEGLQKELKAAREAPCDAAPPGYDTIVLQRALEEKAAAEVAAAVLRDDVAALTRRCEAHEADLAAVRTAHADDVAELEAEVRCLGERVGSVSLQSSHDLAAVQHDADLRGVVAEEAAARQALASRQASLFSALVIHAGMRQSRKLLGRPPAVRRAATMRQRPSSALN
eukprot:TRINITY_DN3293_c0_g2_i1.p1 TRINITY_DN3293_c0_g2~~TRINITY_DN3293_c0_g2_i1.p1  ORF type:complete len:808 (+),score=277.02 TRINITY_DN3293_c0_g2_i1:202-2424(+)